MTRRGTCVVEPAVRRAIVAHARRDRPHECAGFLIGRGRRVIAAAPMENVAASPVRYRIDDAAHIDLRRTLRALSPPLEIVGVYHSHPTGDPVPSPTDIAEAHYPDWFHVIVGLKAGRARVRAFAIGRGNVRELTIVSGAAARTRGV